jgi:hypothetical protein
LGIQVFTGSSAHHFHHSSINLANLHHTELVVVRYPRFFFKASITTSNPFFETIEAKTSYRPVADKL